MIRHFLFFLFLAYSFFSAAQTRSFTENRMLETKVHYGFIWPHHTSIAYSTNKHIPAFEINYLHQTDGQNFFDALYNYPRIGMGTSYSHLHKHEVFGSALGYYGFFDFSLYDYKFFTFSYRIYGGLSWLTKIWDFQKNPLHTAIGSHINLYFRVSANTRFKLNQKLELTFDFGLTHFSNGRIKNPNLGLNLVTISSGLTYNINYNNHYSTISPEKPELKNWNINITSYNGYKALGNFKNTYYYKSALNLLCGYNINHKKQYGVGVDLFYDGSIKGDFLPTNPNSKPNLLQTGLIVYQDLRYNKLVLTVQIGYYVYNKHNYTAIYNRCGLKYYFKKNFYGSVCLKSHKTQADYVEWGIGYTL